MAENRQTFAELKDPTRAEVRRLLRDAVSTVLEDSPHSEADGLLLMALQTSDSLLLTANETVEKAALLRLDTLVQQRLDERKPLSLLRGSKGFWAHDFLINDQVLDPRPDSEVLIEACLSYAEPDRNAPLSILDLGTGSGCLLLSLLHELPKASGLGIDSSAEAIAVAAANRAQIQLSQPERCSFKQATWHKETPIAFLAPESLGRFDIVVCNPPYIAEEDASWMSPEVLRHDPATALFAGKQGLDDYAVIFPLLHDLLKPDGIGVFEHGFQQRGSVSQLAQDSGFHVREAKDDLAGNARCLVLSPNKV